MFSNKSLIYAASLISVSCLPFASVAQADMNLKQALEITAGTNPQIKANQASADARKNVIRQAEAGYLPKVDASISGGPERTRQKTNASVAGPAQNYGTTLFRRNPAINVVQNVFDGYKTRGDIDRATTDYIQGTKKVDETNEQLSYQAAAAYIKVRRFQRLRREAERNLAAHKVIAGKVDQMIKAGRASEADRATIAARLATAENAVTDIQGDLDDATAEFKSLVGVEPDRLVSAKVPDEYLPKCVNDAVMVAREHNKTVILARSSLDVATAEMNVVNAAFYPKLSVEASAARAKNNIGKDGRTDTYNVLGVLRYNLYNGGADSAKVQEISQKMAEQRYLVDYQLRVAEEETRRSWAQKISTTANSVQQRKAVEALRKEKEAFEQQYELGTRTLIDVLGSINEYFLARGALITSDAAQDTSSVRLLASMGMLTAKFGTAYKSPELFSDKDVKKVNATYSPEHCNNPGGLPEPKAIDDKSKEEVLQQLAHTAPIEATTQTSQKSEDGIFSWFTNLAEDSPSTTVTTQPTKTEAPAATASQKTSEENSFFSSLMTDLTGYDSSSTTTGASQTTTTATTPQTATEETGFFSSFLADLTGHDTSSTTASVKQAVEPNKATITPARKETSSTKTARKTHTSEASKKAYVPPQRVSTAQTTGWETSTLYPDSNIDTTNRSAWD